MGGWLQELEGSFSYPKEGIETARLQELTRPDDGVALAFNRRAAVGVGKPAADSLGGLAG